MERFSNVTCCPKKPLREGCGGGPVSLSAPCSGSGSTLLVSTSNPNHNPNRSGSGLVGLGLGLGLGSGLVGAVSVLRGRTRGRNACARVAVAFGVATYIPAAVRMELDDSVAALVATSAARGGPWGPRWSSAPPPSNPNPKWVRGSSAPPPSNPNPNPSPLPGSCPRLWAIVRVRGSSAPSPSPLPGSCSRLWAMLLHVALR